MDAALAGGAAYLGFMVYPPSPRNIAVEDIAALAGSVPSGFGRVAVTVDADDALVERIVATGVILSLIHI